MEKVSIIIPAYNKAELTVKTIDSVLKQTYSNIEIIVIDDGSTDHTREILSFYHDRIKYIYKENGGACSARNFGIKKAEGDFIGFIDCDDMYAIDKVELSVKYLKKNPEFGCLHTGACFIDENDEIVGEYSHPMSRRQGWVSKRLILHNFICNSTVFIRRNVLERAGFFDEEIFTPADWDMWIRLAEITQVTYIDYPLTYYRVSDNYIFNRLDLAEKEEKFVIEKYFKRNSHMGNFFQRCVLSNLYLRFAQCYFLKNDRQLLKEKFLTALYKNPLNLKAIVLLFYFLFFRKNLRTELTRRILRINYQSKPRRDAGIFTSR